jgi:hypothetical protein
LVRARFMLTEHTHHEQIRAKISRRAYKLHGSASCKQAG